MLWATWIDTRIINAACSATTPAETTDGMSGAFSDPSIITRAVRRPQDSSDKELFEEHQKMHSGGVCTLIALLLLHIFFPSCLAAKDPFGLAVNIGLVLDSDAAEVTEDILHLGICVAASSTTHVVDSLHADKDEIDHSDDNDAADRVTPDDNSGDD